MKAFKLTNEHHRTCGETQWGPSVTHEAPGEGYLCGPGWLHFYRHPEIAVLMNPIHANFSRPVLWAAKAEGKFLHEGFLKSGCTSLTTLEILPLLEISTTQRIAFGILCAMEVCAEPEFRSWAEKWLSGEDRSERPATTPSSWAAETARAAAEAVWAARAANTTWAAWQAAVAADAASEAAEQEHRTLDLVAVAKKALTFF